MYLLIFTLIEFTTSNLSYHFQEHNFLQTVIFQNIPLDVYFIENTQAISSPVSSALLLKN